MSPAPGGSGEAVRIVVPMPPPLTNASGRSRGWRTVNRAKKCYWEQLDDRQNYGLIPAPPAVAFPRARIRATLYLGNAMDDDNAVARCKWALDWLRTRGYIVDDRKRVLTWSGFPEQVVKRGQEYRIELTLTPLPRAG